MRNFIAICSIICLLPSARAADRPTPLPGQAHRSETVAANGMVCETVELGARWLAEAVGDVDVAVIEDLATQARAAANRT